MNPATDPDRPLLPYVIPMAAFVLLTALEGQLPKGSGPTWYPLAYGAKVAAVSVLAWLCRSTWRDLAPRPGVNGLALALVVGLLVTALWVGLDGRYPELKFLGSRTEFNPHVLARPARWAFIVVRLFGLVALVPLIEELFWRSFVMRWLIAPDFRNVPIGRVTPLAASATAVLFGLAHPEWLPGILTGFLWAWLLGRTKSVTACVISHAVANLALGLYVLSAGAWKFW